MTTLKFEIGQKYGNDLITEVISRSEKFITIKSVFGVNWVKINHDYIGEIVYFKCWSISSNELFDADTAREISYYNAYCK